MTKNLNGCRKVRQDLQSRKSRRKNIFMFDATFLLCCASNKRMEIEFIKIKKMKRLVLKIVPALICGVAFLVASSCNKEDFSAFNNSDKFRLVKVLTYSDSSASDLVGERVYTYDKTGNMIKESFYERNHSTKILLYYSEYEYSENKKVKEKFFGGVAGSPTLNSYTLYFYEGDKLVKEEYYSGFNGVLSLYDTRNYEYDKKGYLVRESWSGYYRGTTISGEGELRYTYDEQNRLILKETIGIDVNNSNNIEYIHKGTSKVPEKELHYDGNGILTVTYQHYYDSLENLIETKIDDECSKFKRKYKGKLLIEEIHFWSSWSWGGCSENGMSRYEYEGI